MVASPSRPSGIERLVASPAVRAGYTSVVVHVLALILLALWLVDLRQRPRPRPVVITLAAADHDEAGLPGGPADAPPLDAGFPDLVAIEPVPEPLPEAAPVPVEAPVAVAAAAADPVADVEARAGVVARPASLASETRSQGDAYAARRGGGRAEAVRGRGGSAASEAAVERGLEWLARHQAFDGSWRCDLSGCRCDGACRDAGTVSSTTASTGIALLPFLGAGHTHEEGPYQEVVARGLYYLLSRMQATPRGGDLGEGTLYGQGIATLALTEAYGMTRDELLLRPARDGLRFIETAQDLHGGGWRYLPGQPGDITSTAWQLAALKSAALAGLEVPSPTIDGVRRFLDRVQVRGGEAYGYLAPQPKPSTSAIGLLCRLYTGWDREDAIDRGLATLARPGPPPDAVYQNFYLAQALLLRDHVAWPRWNPRNRDQLVARQAANGHEAGSWTFDDGDTAPGGRLAHTALAVLTLEVYYRLLPIYGTDAADTGL